MNDFSFEIVKSGEVRIRWRGRHVVTLRGTRAERFLDQSSGKSGDALQIVLARFTGNFKRGNEREVRQGSP